MKFNREFQVTISSLMKMIMIMTLLFNLPFSQFSFTFSSVCIPYLNQTVPANWNQLLSSWVTCDSIHSAFVAFQYSNSIVNVCKQTEFNVNPPDIRNKYQHLNLTVLKVKKIYSTCLSMFSVVWWYFLSVYLNHQNNVHNLKTIIFRIDDDWYFTATSVHMVG